jgi:hypothetical protein
MPGARDLKKEREGQTGPEDVVTTAPARRLPLQMANNCTQTAATIRLSNLPVLSSPWNGSAPPDGAPVTPPA